MAFSTPYRYVQLDPALAAAPRGAGAGADVSPAAAWDAALDAGCDVYCRRMHNICCDNCHHHVARCLNEMRYDGRSDWGQVRVAALVILGGTWVSPRAAAAVWVPFAVIAAIVLAMGLR